MGLRERPQAFSESDVLLCAQEMLPAARSALAQIEDQPLDGSGSISSLPIGCVRSSSQVLLTARSGSEILCGGQDLVGCCLMPVAQIAQGLFNVAAQANTAAGQVVDKVGGATAQAKDAAFSATA